MKKACALHHEFSQPLATAEDAHRVKKYLQKMT